MDRAGYFIEATSNVKHDAPTIPYVKKCLTVGMIMSPLNGFLCMHFFIYFMCPRKSERQNNFDDHGDDTEPLSKVYTIIAEFKIRISKVLDEYSQKVRLS